MVSRKRHNPNQTKKAAQRQRTAKPVRQAPVVQMLQPARFLLQRAVTDPSQAAPTDVLALQQAYGNRAVSPLLTQASPPRIQTRLTVNPPGDRYEQEADRVAAQVVQMSKSANLQMGAGVQRQEEEEELQAKPLVQRQAEEEEELQMKPVAQRQPGGGGMVATPELEAAIQQAQGSGHSLSDDVRAPMEQAFGADFSGVRAHTDAEADTLNQSLQARAFTIGQDIFFRKGEYSPGSSAGNELIAHELTHVRQQTGVTRAMSLDRAQPAIVQNSLSGKNPKSIQLYPIDFYELKELSTAYKGCQPGDYFKLTSYAAVEEDGGCGHTWIGIYHSRGPTILLNDTRVSHNSRLYGLAR